MSKKPHHEDEPHDPGPMPDIPEPPKATAPPAPGDASAKLPKDYDLRINELMADEGAEDKAGGEQPDGPEVSPLALAAAQRANTVTCNNPTPPTNIVCAQGFPPTTYAWAAAPAAGNPLIFAVPTVGTYLPEGSGNEVNVPFPGAAAAPPGAGGSANSDLGNFIEFANFGHPSYKT